MTGAITSLLRWRVVQTFNAGNSEITTDLPTLRLAHIEVVAFQPGNPGSSALGSFTIKLHPPGSEGYRAAKPIYDKLDYFNRVEGYISADGASLGKLYYAGIVTQIRKSYGANAVFELSGNSDIVLANLSRPFPGELLSNDVTSAMLKSFLGTNELAASADTFNPFTSGNYTSTNGPGGTSGTWSGTTDDGFNVVSCATGTFACLISKTGAAYGDRWRQHYVEVTGRLSPSSDTTNSGGVGVGVTNATGDVNNSVLGVARLLNVGGRQVINAGIYVYNGGSGTNQVANSALINVDDPQGMVPLTLGLLVGRGGNSNVTATATLTINGKVVIGQFPTNFDLTVTHYPFLYFSTPATGSATAYLTNLIQMTRFTTDGPSAAATFGNGTISAATHSLAYGNDPGPTLLEAWSRLATREGWYWRYTPTPYAIGTRTLGTVDFEADPGTDYGTNQTIVFSENSGNLVSLDMTANADSFATDTAATGQSTVDGGGIGIWRDIGTMQTHGVIQDEVLSFTHTDFNTLRRAAFQAVSNKINLSGAGSKTVTVLRDPQTADKFRELDKVMIHCPMLGINYLVTRVIGYIFDENNPAQILTLDQFSADES